MIALYENNGLYDLLIKNGSMVQALTAPQNRACILRAHKGDYKEHPLLGVGLSDIVNDHDFTSWKREIVEQLEADGHRIAHMDISQNGLTIDFF